VPSWLARPLAIPCPQLACTAAGDGDGDGDGDADEDADGERDDGAGCSNSGSLMHRIGSGAQ
jgi:hypothetical protein